MNQAKEEAESKCHDVHRRRASIEATHTFLERMKAEKVHGRAELAATLEELEAQFGPEHKIEQGRSLVFLMR